MRAPGIVVVLLAVSTVCCGKASSGGGEVVGGACTDADGDGFGLRCAAGPDCDDGDPLTYADCAACAGGAARLGCSCPAAGAVVSCFDGTAAEAATPPCHKGQSRCDPTTLTWGECENEVAPAREVCDSFDNDCDGSIDEDAMCTGCSGDCDQAGVGDGAAFPLPGAALPAGIVAVTANGVGLDPNGDLVLDQQGVDYHFLWVANSAEGTVSKLDTITGREVARYPSVTRRSVVNVGSDGAAALDGWGPVHSPSRTAVDFYGNIWVANRAFDHQPSATKIMNDDWDCIDRDGDGMIETSTDANGDGRIDTNAAAVPREFFGDDMHEDECIAITVVVGMNNGVARAAAVDAGVESGDPGRVWIGMYNEHAFYQLDGKTGALVRRVAIPGANPYGAAIDSKGTLWAVNDYTGVGIIPIDTATGVVGAQVNQGGWCPSGQYGIAVDLKDRIWLGGWTCGDAKRYDPVAGSWLEVDIFDPLDIFNFHSGRGICADAAGNVWMAVDGAAGQVVGIDADTGAKKVQLGTNGAESIGVAVDFDGNVWTVNRDSNSVSRVHIDPGSHAPSMHPATGKVVDVFPVGSGPYTYSDFTGLGLRSVTRPSGEYALSIEGCPDGQPAHWLTAKVDSTTPAGTSVELAVRAGDDPATLSGQPAIEAWTSFPADLQAPPGPVPDSRFLQVVVRLVSGDREHSPVVHSLDLEWSCGTVPVE